jgi:integrase
MNWWTDAAMGKLTARKVGTARPGKHIDGDGLQLVVDTSGARRWVLRFTWKGKRREMGLGGFPDISLLEAREKAIEARKLVRAGIDPVASGKKEKAVPTFGEVADEVMADLSAGFSNEKHRAQWQMTLDVHAASLRPMHVDAIGTAEVLAVLKPLWTETPVTASRLRGRIEKVLNAAKANGYRSGENPAIRRGHLDNLLPRQPKLPRGRHAALDYADVPAFMGKLRERDAIAARALEFTILTAARSSEARGATRAEIDWDARVWTLPAARMKARREHRVPLSDTAMAVLKPLFEHRMGELIFTAPRGGQLTDKAMSAILRRMGIESATVHGFRSAFRDWCGNETTFPRELAEQALAHLIGDKAEQAYRRSDALKLRRRLMQAWANFCEANATGNVVPLARG